MAKPSTPPEREAGPSESVPRPGEPPAHGRPDGAHRESPAISIITTAYRTERYLPDTIRSVLAQTRSDWELVIVDNGMSDEVVRIATGFADERITIVRKENEGYSAGVDAGAAVARGRCIATLDSDDIMQPRFCQRMVGILDNHPEIDAVGADSHIFFDGGHRRFRSHFQSLGYWRPPRLDRRLTLADVLGGYQPSDGAVVRKHAWDAVGGCSPGVRKVEDLSLYLRLLEAGFDVRAVSDRLIWFRFRPASTSRASTDIDDFERAIATALTESAERSGRRADLLAARRRIRRNRGMYAMRHAGEALQRGDTELATAHARTAVQMRPSVRNRVIMTLLRLSPGLARQVHPRSKQLTARGLSLYQSFAQR